MNPAPPCNIASALPRLAAEAATRVYERVDRPLVAVIAAMERHGIKVDRERLAGLSATFAEEIARLEREG